ncbi:MAG: hypothetical protein QOD47_599 [Gemmatimonadaceae bacterium]|jgi:hypothetical protein|nr:hypothetical protein [Gemmatimonadaceae bacterium]
MRSVDVAGLRAGNLVNKFTISMVAKSTVIYALPFGSGRP